MTGKCITHKLGKAGTFIMIVMVSAMLMMLFYGCGGSTPAPVKRVVKKKVQKPVTARQAETEESSVPDEISSEGYVYQRRDRRDPFVPLIVPASRKHKKEMLAGTLQSYDLSDFSLSAIARKGSRYFALLVTPDNRSFTVRQGMKIGLNKGKVREVSKGRVVLVEYSRDFRGELKPRQITLEFNKGEGK